MKNIVFIGGPSGVGKSTLCNTLINRTNGSVKISFFSRISALAQNTAREEKLQLWNALQDQLAVELSTYLEHHSLVIVDTHYSFQPKGGPDIAFAKRGYKTTVPGSLTFTEGFIRRIARNPETRVILVVLRQLPSEILERQKQDCNGHLMSLEEILYEQECEITNWDEAYKRFGQYCDRLLPIMIFNQSVIETASVLLGLVQ